MTGKYKPATLVFIGGQRDCSPLTAFILPFLRVNVKVFCETQNYLQPNNIKRLRDRVSQITNHLLWGDVVVSPHRRLQTPFCIGMAKVNPSRGRPPRRLSMPLPLLLHRLSPPPAKRGTSCFTVSPLMQDVTMPCLVVTWCCDPAHVMGACAHGLHHSHAALVPAPTRPTRYRRFRSAC